MRPFGVLALVLCHLLCLASANVEKAIFLAPHAAARDPLLHDSSEPPSPTTRSHRKHLAQLTPSKNCVNGRCRSLRTLLDTSFESNGKEHWVLLDALEKGARYEVRICWPATSPTDFYLTLHTAQSVMSNLSLSTSLTEYQSPATARFVKGEQDIAIADTKSFLYLHVRAKTGYYSYDKQRMENPEPVEVEIILDPYFFNIIPESLLPLGGFVIATALLALPGSAWVYKLLKKIAASEDVKKYRKIA